MLSLMMSEIEVICLPKDIPEYLEIDVAELHLGESIHLSQIKMPKGVEIVALTHDEDGDHDLGVVIGTEKLALKLYQMKLQKHLSKKVTMLMLLKAILAKVRQDEWLHLKQTYV